MSQLLLFILKILKPTLGGMKITFDREKQLVHIIQQGKETILTYDQAIDEVEKLFNEE